jgi:hypothetical protein
MRFQRHIEVLHEFQSAAHLMTPRRTASMDSSGTGNRCSTSKASYVLEELVGFRTASLSKNSHSPPKRGSFVTGGKRNGWQLERVALNGSMPQFHFKKERP